MILDFVAKTGAYTLRVPRAQSEKVQSLIKVHGFDFSVPASTPDTAVLFTKEPFAAAGFAERYGTDGAKAQLAEINGRVADSWRDSSDARIRCPAGEELMPFQRASIAYALGRRNTLVADQPGLGKTPIAICFANEIRAKRVLVICPANIRGQWVSRIRRWTTMDWPYIVYPIFHGRHGVNPGAQWTIVSYDLAGTPEIGRALAAGTYDLVILDEAHYLKTVEAHRTRAIFGDHTGWCRKVQHENPQHPKMITGWDKLFPALASRCGAILALTGTPLPNRPRECYTLAKHMCFDAIDFMTEDSFKERFNPTARITGQRADGTEYIYTREEVGRASELQTRLRANFMVRHLKRDVLPQLNIPRYDLVYVDETSAVKQVLAAEGLLEIDISLLEKNDIQTMGVWAVVRRLMGIAIAPQVAEYATMCLDGGEEKLTIFAWHTAVLDILEERLSKFGVVRIDGSTSGPQRVARVKAFVEKPEIQIILGNTMALGVGVDDLQKVCDHALLAEPDPVPGTNQQAVDRLDRIGQKGTVQADLFVAPKSLLEKILASSLRKLRDTTKVLDERT